MWDIDSFNNISPKENEINQQTKSKMLHLEISIETIKNENDYLFLWSQAVGVTLGTVNTLQQELVSDENISNIQLRVRAIKK